MADSEAKPGTFSPCQAQTAAAAAVGMLEKRWGRLLFLFLSHTQRQPSHPFVFDKGAALSGSSSMQAQAEPQESN